MITAKIKNYKTGPDKVMGSTELFKDQCLIKIYLDKNKDLITYSSTLLHELLHLWIAVLQVYGLNISKTKEHKFIDLAERRLVQRLFTIGRTNEKKKQKD